MEYNGIFTLITAGMSVRYFLGEPCINEQGCHAPWKTWKVRESQGKNIGPGKSGKIREFFARPWIFYFFKHFPYVGNELPRKEKLA